MATMQSVQKSIEEMAEEFQMDAALLSRMARQVSSLMANDGIKSDVSESDKVDISSAYLEEAGRQEQRLVTHALTHKKEFQGIIYSLLKTKALS